jgi:hypothetical protein
MMPADDAVQPSPTLVEAAVIAVAESVATGMEGTAGVVAAGSDAAGGVIGSAISGVASTSQVVSAGGAAMTVTFSDIEAMTTSIQSVNQVVVPIIASAAALAVDGDLLESLVLSPITGAGAEAAALLAATQLTAKLVVFEGLALVTATVVSTYQLADSTLQASAAAIGGGAAVGGSIFGGAIAVGGAGISGAVDVGGTAISGIGGVAIAGADLATTAVTLPLLVSGLAGAGLGSLFAGFASETAETLTDSLNDAVDEFWRDPLGAVQTRGIPLAVGVGQSFFENFSATDAWGNTAENLGNVLGATGPYFDDILARLIHDGQTLGMFRDGEAELGASGLSDDALAKLAATSANESRLLAGLTINTEEDTNRVIPHDVSSLLAGARQIDATGADDFAEIRIIESVTTVQRDGVWVEERAYTVQIPSTQVWNPYAGPVPNDLTADLLAVHGDQTALMNSVFDAMEEHGIPTGAGAPPVMTVGFSLGGITAAAMAADPRGYNIQQVVTAGSPISEMAIPTDVGVTALMADEDLVPVASGGQNPAAWTTVDGSGSILAAESADTVLHPGNAHDANRYAVMASEHPEVNSDPAITDFLSGDEVTVTDYYSTRK